MNNATLIISSKTVLFCESVLHRCLLFPSAVPGTDLEAK